MPCFYGNWWLTIIFTSAHQWTQSWTRWIESTSSYSVSSSFSLTLLHCSTYSKISEVILSLEVFRSTFLSIPCYHTCYIPCPSHHPVNIKMEIKVHDVLRHVSFFISIMYNIF
jgi:hypothetical protein